MQFFTILILIQFSPVLLTKNEESLHKYKSEIHKIGSDVEEFIFDIAKEVFKNADTLFNFDYEENVRSEEENYKINNVKNKENDKSYEEDPTSNTIEQENPTINNVINKESYEDDPVNNEIEDSNKKKRSIDPIYDEQQPMPIDNFVGEIQNSKSIDEKEKILEDKHIKEIKEELVKLYELIAILKDQQTMVSLLDEKPGLPQGSDPKTLLNVLEHINHNLNDEKERYKKLPTHKELEKLKLDLRKAISSLNQSKNILKEEKEKESLLEHELIHQQEQIDLLKSLIDKIISENVKTKPTQIPVANFEDKHTKISDIAKKDDKDIVGAPIFIPKDFPKLKNDMEIKSDIPKKPDGINKGILIHKSDELKQNKPVNENNEQHSVKTESNYKKEASTTPNKDKSVGLDDTHKARSSELETQLGELEKKTEKENTEDNIKPEMTLIRKLLEQEKPSSRTFTEDDVDFLKKLLKVTDSSSKPQGKSDDIEDELKKLENAINILKPKAEVKVLDFPSSKTEPLPKGSTITLSTDQIIELRKKLDDIIDMQAKKDIKNILSIGKSSRKFDMPKGSFPYPMWYRPFGPDGMPPPFDYAYYPNFFNPFYPPPSPYVPYDSFNNDYGQNAYDYGSNYESVPYHQQNSSDATNHFFQDTHIAPTDNHNEEFEFNQDEHTRRSSQLETNPLKHNYDVNAKIKFINDLKMEISTLEKRIANLKSQGNNGNFEDKSIIIELEKEIQGLKNIFNHSSQEIKPVTEESQQSDHKVQQRSKRSIENGETTNKVSLEEQSDVHLYDDLTSKLREYLVEDTSTKARTAQYEDIRGRIDKIKSQLGLSPMIREDFKNPHENYYQPPKFEYNKVVPNSIKFPVTPPKKDDFMSNMIVKVLDKVIALIPKIIGKLFGESIEGLIDKIEYDKSVYGYDKSNSNYGVSNKDYSNNLESTFYSLGAFGYIPLIILKIINCFSTFVNILKKNKFVKNFLVPAFVLLIVSGAVIFLIWWFKDDGTNSLRQIGFENQRMSSEDFNKYRSIYTGTDYYSNNFKNVPYQRSFYPYYYRNYPYPNSKEVDSRTVNNIVPGLYYRTYFESGSNKHH